MADIGSVLHGRYEVLSELGRDGLSTVYMAVDREQNKTWAVKQIQTGEDGRKNAALMESMLMVKLSHASLPRVEEVFETENALYMVMEYLPGRTLADTVRAFGPMCPADAIRVGIRLCEALDRLHTQPTPIVFCGLKPSNVMLTDRAKPAVKLLDLGAARVYDEFGDRQTGGSGTTGFAAPELTESGGWADTRADVYSLGAVLFFLLTGEAPTANGLLDRAPDGRESGGLGAVLRRCLEKDPGRRYASCAQARRDLEQCLARGDALGPAEKNAWERLAADADKAVALSPAGKGTSGFCPDADILVCEADAWL